MITLEKNPVMFIHEKWGELSLMKNFVSAARTLFLCCCLTEDKKCIHKIILHAWRCWLQQTRKGIHCEFTGPQWDSMPIFSLPMAGNVSAMSLWCHWFCSSVGCFLTRFSVQSMLWGVVSCSAQFFMMLSSWHWSPSLLTSATLISWMVLTKKIWGVRLLARRWWCFLSHFLTVRH